MKAQSSIEYLTTYGWMFLAVSVAGSVVFSTVQQDCPVETSGFGSQDLQVQDTGVSTQKRLQFAMKNNDFEKVQIKALQISPESSNNSRYATRNKNITSGEVEPFDIPGFKLSDDSGTCREYDMTIIYDKGPLDNQQIAGSVEGRFQTINITSPPAPQELTIQS
jgi:hypothetical protein